LVWECRETSWCECGGLAQDKSAGGSYYHAVENHQEDEVVQKEQRELFDAIQCMRRESAYPVADVGRHVVNFPEPPPASEYLVSPMKSVSSVSDTWIGSSNVNEQMITSTAPLDAIMYQELAPTVEADSRDCPELVFHFHRIAEQCSALKLTRSSDKLVAFSDLCQRVSHLRQRYLAGLWSDSICYNLLW
jgi:hypothetical protein